MGVVVGDVRSFQAGAGGFSEVLLVAGLRLLSLQLDNPPQPL